MNIIVASHNEEILNNNLMRSNLPSDANLVIMRGYNNVAKAYNDAIKKTKRGITMFVHHDVYLPDGWFKKLDKIMREFEYLNIGVIGVAGASRSDELEYKGNIINSGNEWKHGRTGDGYSVEDVQTVDEMLFIVRDNNVSFDENLGNHFYCADLCLRMIESGKDNYVINNPCSHVGSENNVKDKDGNFVYSDSFYKSRDIIASKYNFPIATTCILIN